MTVTLGSDHPALAAVPASVTVPHGQTTASFPVTTSLTAVAVNVLITASGPNGSASTTLNVTDDGLPLPNVPGAATPPVYNPANGHWYQEVVPSQRITWPDAEAAAELVSFAGGRGHLATVTSPAENQFVSAYLSAIGPQGGIWLGALQDRTARDYSEPAGGWRWITGEPWGYTSWSGGEPNNAGGGEDALEGNSLGSWNDVAVLAGDPAYLIE